MEGDSELRKASHRHTIVFIDRGERVGVELSAGMYEAYQQEAAQMRVPIETVLRRSLRPVVNHVRRTRRQHAPETA